MLSSVSDYRPEIRDIFVAISFARLLLLLFSVIQHPRAADAGSSAWLSGSSAGASLAQGDRNCRCHAICIKSGNFTSNMGNFQQLPGSSSNSSSIAKDGYNWPKAATIYQRRLPFVLTTSAVNNQTTRTTNTKDCC